MITLLDSTLPLKFSCCPLRVCVDRYSHLSKEILVDELLQYLIFYAVDRVQCFFFHQSVVYCTCF